MLEEAAQPIRIFFCYARRDQDLRDELDRHLTPLRRSGQMIVWYDGKIIPGAAWEDEIESQLNTADIILLLISPDFMSSEYIYSKEMKRALERHAAREVSVIPILLRQVYWEGTPLSRLQMLPANAKPVSSWADRDEAFTDVARGIGRVINNLRTQRVPRILAVEEPVASFDSRPFPQKLSSEPLKPLTKGKIILPVIAVFFIVVSIFATSFLSRKSSLATTSTTSSLAVATAAVIAYNKAVGANGTMFGFDAQHSHANPYEYALSIKTVKNLKALEPRITEGAIEAAPIVANSQVYVVSKGHNLYVFSENGSSMPVWIAQIKAPISTVPVVSGDMIYVSDDSGILHAFPTNGCGDYICDDPGGIRYGKSSGASPTAVNGIIYIASEDNKLSAIRASDRKILWTGQTDGADISTSPAVYQGMIYASVNSGNLYAFNAGGCGQSKCLARWTASFADSDTTGASPTISKADGMVYIATEGSGVNFFAFRTAGCGQPKCSSAWEAALDGSIGASPAVVDGKVYVVSEQGTLFVFKSSGCGQLICQPLWKSALKRKVENSPTVANGVIYIGSEDGHLAALDANGCGSPAKDCSPIIDIQVSNTSLTSPTIANGIIYVGSSDGKLYAYHPA